MTTATRRRFLATGALATAAGMLRASDDHHEGKDPQRILLSLKGGMCKDGNTLEEKFQLLKELGYDGIELDSPGGQNKEEAKAASAKVGLPIHGVVDSIHWGTTLSDPSAEKREKGLEGLLTAIRESHFVGGSAVLLVPAVVNGEVSEQQAWERSIEQIRKALPLAASLGVHILIENVWNRFLYDHDGPNTQGADRLVKYIDEIDSPWVGSYFDIGNHQKYGKPADWIRALGRRIVKVDVKDWGVQAGFSKIGAGDVDWPDVRKALAEIQFTGWATAEVGGGNRERCAEILANMRKHLLGHEA
jgi:hexulose-6-phosphate isomerase